MSRVFITGSSDGLGLMAARLLVADGHSVTLHARNQARADAARAALPQADGAVIGEDELVQVFAPAGWLSWAGAGNHGPFG